MIKQPFKMLQYHIENRLGNSPPFLLRNIKNKYNNENDLFKKNSIKNIPYHINNEITYPKNHLSECSIYFIPHIHLKDNYTVKDMKIRGFQENIYRINNIEYEIEVEKYITNLCILCKQNKEKCKTCIKTSYTIKDIKNTRTINYNCFLDTQLFIELYTDNTLRFYTTKFNLCILRDKIVKAYRVNFNDENKNGEFVEIEEEPSLFLELKVINYKQKINKESLHYVWYYDNVNHKVSDNNANDNEREKYNINNNINDNSNNKNDNNNIITNNGNNNIINTSNTVDNTKINNMKINGNLYIFNTKCILCLKEFKNINFLLFHINFTHMNYRAEIIENILIYKYIGSIISEESNTNEINKNVNDLVETMNKMFYFIGKLKVPRKYKCFDKNQKESKKKNKILNTNDNLLKKKYFILDGDVNMQWLYYLNEKRMDEIIDMPEVKLKIMKEWNRYMLEYNIYVGNIDCDKKGMEINYFSCANGFQFDVNKYYSVENRDKDLSINCRLILNFIKDRNKNKELFDLLVVFYQKSLISMKELINILKRIK
ncbi:hypothetical protein SLOPH_1096 [Spraguea lophii 42_110]|uniref:C2H2-type domain-containing protein n=1 Tax=Spraguea lophii (strain 42_110) TaxID=1358809 RepID=S7W9W6_SPRLO|nr:hypothetical protein SLOPH_1096 [Spraguea lophii 42_110]